MKCKKVIKHVNLGQSEARELGKNQNFCFYGFLVSILVICVFILMNTNEVQKSY